MATKESYLRHREKRLEHMRVYYQKNKESIRAYSKKYYEENKDRTRESRLIYSKAYNQKNAVKKSQYARDRWKRIRIELFEHLGGAWCKNCKYDDYRALQIDHIYGGGRKEHKDNPHFKSISRWAEHVKNNSSNYQVLCANCNQIKRYTHNEFRKKDSI